MTTLTLRALVQMITAIVVAAGVVACNEAPEPIAPSAIAATPKSTVTAIQVSGGADEVGQQSQFRATAVYASGLSADVTNEVHWTAENFTVASVSATGMVAAVKQGPAQVNASLQSVTGSRRWLIGGSGSYIMYLSDPGDPVGQGRIASRANDLGFIRGTREDVNRVSVLFELQPGSQTHAPAAVALPATDPSFRDWEVQFAAPAGQVIAPGTFENALLWPLQPPSRPSMRVWIDGRTCDQESGRFVIREIVYNLSGGLQKLDATFEQRCRSSAGGLRGLAAFNR